MAEGYNIDLGRFAVGYYKVFTYYGKFSCRDGGTIYQFWRFYLHIKNK